MSLTTTETDVLINPLRDQPTLAGASELLALKKTCLALFGK